MNMPQKWIFAERLVQLVARHLRQPVVDRREEGEDEPAHDRVVEVGHREEAAVRGHVARRVGEEDARQAADQEVEEPGEREQHRHREADLAAPERHHPAEEREAGRDRDQLGREHVERAQVAVDAAHEQVVLPDEPGEQRHAEHARDREPVAPERLAREHGQQLEHDPEAGQGEDVHLRVPEDPEQVLVQVRAAAGAARKNVVCAVRSSALHRQRREEHGRREHHQHRRSRACPRRRSAAASRSGPGARMVRIVAIMFRPSSVIEMPTSAKKRM